MSDITFDAIYSPSTVVFENDVYRHFHYEAFRLMYGANYIEFLKMPSVEAFKEAEKYLRAYHLRRGQHHVKFYFPENEKIEGELLAYLQSEKYNSGFLELYTIAPEQFPTTAAREEIEVRLVTDEDVPAWLALRYEDDCEFGEAFAQKKKEEMKRRFADERFQHVWALYQGKPAGYVDVIVAEKTIEIDNLGVHETYRNKGIATQLQQFALRTFPREQVILVADGEDTPRDMYQKQNYQCRGFQYEVMKVYEPVQTNV